jgi:hypothetical protein
MSGGRKWFVDKDEEKRERGNTHFIVESWKSKVENRKFEIGGPRYEV